jgi:large subunit ribosomal protein L29
MKVKELRDKSIAELNAELSSLLKAHFGLRMQRATQQLTNTSQLGKVKRDIARVKTVLGQKGNKHERGRQIENKNVRTLTRRIISDKINQTVTAGRAPCGSSGVGKKCAARVSTTPTWPRLQGR